MVGMSGANTNCPSPGKEAKPIRAWMGAAFALISRYLLGAVFLMAAVSKIVNLRDFESQVLLHSSLPEALAKLLPNDNLTLSFRIVRIGLAILPWLELTCGLCLLFARTVRESALIMALLLSMFIVQGITLRSDDCHCFFLPGLVSTFPWWLHVVRDTLLLSCSLFLVCKSIPKDRKPDNLG
jgi:putative oxidoreductase